MKKTIYSTALLFFLSLSITFFIVSCCSTKKVTAKQEILDMKPMFQISPGTQLFLADLKKELKANKSNLDSFNPSEELIEKFVLAKSDQSSYSVKGFAKTDSNLDQSSLEKLGIQIGSNLGGQRSLLIPLKSFGQFLQLEGISYFEIAKKAQLKQ